MVQCWVPAVIKSIPAGIPQLSHPSPWYSRNIHTHTRGFRGIPAIPVPMHISKLYLRGLLLRGGKGRKGRGGSTPQYFGLEPPVSALGVFFSWAWSYCVWTALFSTHQFLAVLKHAAEHRAQLMKVRPSLHAELEKLLLVCQQATALPALSQSANSFPPLSRRRDAG